MGNQLALKGLKVSYGPVNAVNGIDLNVEDGSVVCLLGANGAGKSSTVNAISGLVKSTGGKIEFNGMDITHLPGEKRVAMGIATCLEGRHIFLDQTVYDNLQLGGYSRKDKTAVKKDIDDIVSRFPILKEKINENAGNLSGGQLQILAIARAYIARPKLLLLDEPSLGLAPILISEVYNMIKELNKGGISVLLVEQFASYALSIGDYAYVLEHGNIVLEGKPDDIKENEILSNAYLGK